MGRTKKSFGTSGNLFYDSLSEEIVYTIY